MILMFVVYLKHGMGNNIRITICLFLGITYSEKIEVMQNSWCPHIHVFKNGHCQNYIKDLMYDELNGGKKNSHILYI